MYTIVYIFLNAELSSQEKKKDPSGWNKQELKMKGYRQLHVLG
jgi:hypothetical protein